MLVYRVERHDGEGPYSDSNIRYELYHIAMGDEHPSPYEDGLSGFTYNHVFGFKDSDQMREWFPYQDRVGMAKYGYHLWVYEVSDDYVMFGGKQIVFEKRRASFRARIALLVYFVYNSRRRTAMKFPRYVFVSAVSLPEFVEDVPARARDGP